MKKTTDNIRMGKKVSEKIKYWGQLFLLPLYGLSFLIPKNKKLWVFGSTFGRRFADNPRYFYLYVSQNEKDIRAVWISHNMDIVKLLNDNGYEAYYYHSLKGIWCALRAGVYLYDNYSKDINFWQSGGAVKFNMWHGVPLKKIQADNIHDAVRHPENLWEKWKSFPRRLSDEKASHYVLATSQFMKPIFASAFRTEHVSTAGYPRIDIFAYDNIKNLLTESEAADIKRIDDYKSRNDKLKVAYYMPTFRDSETLFFDTVNIDEFKEFLVNNNILFICKLHPKSKLRNQFARLDGQNIININQDSDPYVFIENSDMLITDYSSIYFDYLFSNKPIIFFDYDLGKYLQDSREMYFDYEEYTPGIKASSQEEFMKALVDCANGKDEYVDEREALRHKMYDECDEEVSSKLVMEIKEIL